MPRRDENGYVVIRETEYEDGPQWWAFLPMAVVASIALVIGLFVMLSTIWNVIFTVLSL